MVVAVEQRGGPGRDLDSRGQIHDLVVGFYREIVFDDLLGPVFAEVAEVDWSVHLPKLIDYWCQILLGQTGYSGFILAPHQQVHELEAFRPELFDRWYPLFVEAVDRGWQDRSPSAPRRTPLEWPRPRHDASSTSTGRLRADEAKRSMPSAARANRDERRHRALPGG